ncbi:family 16 glycoside hydrolase [Luteolibacter algae]|uniref:Family 16 glycoside hydrolase n=1 Tax=Luteolibacter algae TaxID=454151 RepID=A0ABW5D8G2_9BACT
MKKTLLSALLLSSFSSAMASEHGKLLFEDDFNRNESQEFKEEIGNGWASNSEGRAGGNKQVDLRDGTMHIYMHATADHAVSVTHPMGFKDGAVEVRFMLENEKDMLGLNFADLTFKEVHAGHLFKVEISRNKASITDLKTGVMANEIYARRKAGNSTPEDQEILKTKRKYNPIDLKTGKWYSLLVTVKGNVATASIDGKEVVSFSSEGIAHDKKETLRLSVPREVVVDDLKIYSSDK